MKKRERNKEDFNRFPSQRDDFRPFVIFSVIGSLQLSWICVIAFEYVFLTSTLSWFLFFLPTDFFDVNFIIVQ